MLLIVYMSGLVFFPAVPTSRRDVAPTAHNLQINSKFKIFKVKLFFICHIHNRPQYDIQGNAYMTVCDQKKKEAPILCVNECMC